MVERYFRDITENHIRRGVFRSVDELECTILEAIENAASIDPDKIALKHLVSADISIPPRAITYRELVASLRAAASLFQEVSAGEKPAADRRDRDCVRRCASGCVRVRACAATYPGAVANEVGEALRAPRESGVEREAGAGGIETRMHGTKFRRNRRRRSSYIQQ